MGYISIIGAGSWGTTLADLLSEKGYDTSLWVYEKDLCDEMKRTRVNSVYLPDRILPENMLITHDIAEAINKSRYILNVVPTQFTRQVIKKALPHMRNDAVIVSASKGIEKNTLLTVSSIIGDLTDHVTAALSGPSFAKEVVNKLPTAVTLACRDAGISLLLQEIFNTPYFRVYTHDDILGVELGGALKNVIAVASGICDGLKLGNNARAALITRGLAEIKRLGLSMGAKEETFTGLSGLGDLVLTCTGALSRNYTLGIKLGQGMSLDQILSETRSVIEGVATAESAFEISQKYNIEMPIIENVYMVLYKGKEPSLAVYDLMNRAPKTEFHT